jgi:hypothetical protein
MWIESTRTIDEFRFEVTTVGAGNMLLGIYDSADTLVYDSGNISVSTLGVKIVTPVSPVVLARGLYYIAIIGSVGFGFRAVSTANTLNILGANPAMGVASQYTSTFTARAFAPFPTTRTPSTTRSSDLIPLILARHV